MSQHLQGKRLTALAAMGLCCLVGLGCAAQVSYSFLNGKPATLRARLGNQSESATDKAVEAGSTPDVYQMSGPGMDPTEKTATVPPVRVSVMPPPDPASSGPPTMLPDIPETAPAPRVPEIQQVAGTTRPVVNEADARPAKAFPWSAHAKPVEELNPADLPDFQPPAAGKAQDTIPIATSSSNPDVLLDPAAAQSADQPVVPNGRPCCQGNGHGVGPDGPIDPGDRPLPTELAMVSHPPYMIEPPDILLLDTIRMVPRPPYTVQPLDVLLVRVSETLPNQPIDGAFVVAPDGTISLGYSYGLVRVAGMSLEMVQSAISKHLNRVLRNPQVSIGLGQFRGMQQLRGEHLVRQDGTISLGTYGCVYVTGMTIPQAKHAIEMHLSQFLLEPEVSLDVFAYNSKVIYVIADGAGFGEQVIRLPVTGKETVLDAISQIQGLPIVASKRRIWVARPVPADHACVQVLPVDWMAITQGGSTATNYQLFPGDRIYIKSDWLICFDNAVAKIVAPIERVLGVTLLGASTVQTIRNTNNNNGTGAVAIVP
jgi:polysaccharide export outer membrane protein